MAVHVKLKIKGPEKKQRISFDINEGQVLTFGRKSGDIILDDSKMSRKHLEIYLTEDGLKVKDLGSHNGSYKDGKKFDKLPFEQGDIIRLGKHQIQLYELHSLNTNSPREEAASALAKENTNTQTEVDGFKTVEPSMRGEPQLLAQEEEEEDKEVEKEAPPKTHEFPAAPSYSGSGYRFYESGKPNPKVVFKFYKESLLYWKSIWLELNLQIPRKVTFPILGILLGIGWGIPAMIYAGRTNFYAFPTALMLFMAVGAALSFGFAYFHDMAKNFLQMKGSLDEYLAYETYVVYYRIPFSLIGALLPLAGSVLSIAVFAWTLHGFIQVFKPNILRLIITWVGLYTILAFVFGGILIGFFVGA